MIIWRGWGVLAVVYTAVAIMLCVGLPSSMLDGRWIPLSAGVGLAAAAAATWFTGRALNVNRPQARFDEWYQARAAQLTHLVDTGGFQLGPGQPLPSSHAEARQQADWLLAEEARTLRTRIFDVHTLFFIPMQYLGYVLGAIAIICLGLGVVTALS